MKYLLLALTILLTGCGIKSDRIRSLTCLGFCASTEVDLTMKDETKENLK